MTPLLDAHTLLWFLADDPKLSATAKAACAFEEDLLEMAKEALDRRVQVTGVRRVVEGRRVAPTLRVTRLVILDEDATESTGSESPS